MSLLLLSSAVRAKAAAKKAKRKAKAERIARALVCTTSDGHPVKLRSGIRHHKLEAKLQAELNRAIRARDYGKPCITCNRPVSEANANAGHCFPVGSHPSVRFHPLNIHSQSSRDNCHLGGNHAAYSAAFIARYGLATFEALAEVARTPRQWTVGELYELLTILRREGLGGYQQRYFDLTGWPVERTAA